MASMPLAVVKGGGWGLRRRPLVSLRSPRVPLGERRRREVSAFALVAEEPGTVHVVHGKGGKKVQAPITWRQMLGANRGEVGLRIAARSASTVEPDPAYSTQACSARKEVLEDICRQGNRGDELPEVSVALLPGVMMVLQQAGLHETTLSFGSSLLGARVARMGEADVRLAMALSACDLARKAADRHNVAEACEWLDEALMLLKTYRGPSISEELEDEIELSLEGMVPECCLEHLGLPLGEECDVVRGGAVRTLQRMMMDEITELDEGGSSATTRRGGGGGTARAGDGSSSSSSSSSSSPVLSASYIADAVRRLTSTELMMLLPWHSLVEEPGLTRQWPGLLQSALSAHVAHGFAHGDLPALDRARALLQVLSETSGAGLRVEKALICVLLGDLELAAEELDMAEEETKNAVPYSASSQIETDMTLNQGIDNRREDRAEEEVSETGGRGMVLATARSVGGGVAGISQRDAIKFVRRSGDGDLLTGFCLLTEKWLNKSILQRFRDTSAVAPSLVAYFDKPWVKVMAATRSEGSPLYWALKKLNARRRIRRASSSFPALREEASAIDTVVASLYTLPRFLRQMFALAVILSLGAGAAAVAQHIPGLAGMRLIPATGFQTSSNKQSRPSSTQQRKPKQQQQQSPSSKYKKTAAASIPPLPTGPPQSKKTAPSSSAKPVSAGLTKTIAADLVSRWQQSKAAALGSGYHIDALPSVLCDPMLGQWTAFAEGAKKEGWHWQYRLYGIDVKSIKNIRKPTSGTSGSSTETVQEAVVFCTVHEGAKVIEKGKATQSYESPYTVRYRMKLCPDGKWRISKGVLER